MKDLNFLKDRLIAHRGMHNIKLGIPENSLKAFERAIEHNYIIELDLHVLKDNTVVVLHDDNLLRMTGVDKDLKDTTYDEIKSLKLNNTENHIPLFKEVLELVDGRVPLVIEFKYDTKAGRLEEEAMNLLKDYKGKYVIKSFNPLTVNWFKKNYPDIIRGQLGSSYEKIEVNGFLRVLLSHMFFNFITKPDFISYNIEFLPNKKVAKFRKNKPVLGWVIRNNEDLSKAKQYCDNFICENIEELNIDNR